MREKIIKLTKAAFISFSLLIITTFATCACSEPDSPIIEESCKEPQRPEYEPLYCEIGYSNMCCIWQYDDHRSVFCHEESDFHCENFCLDESDHCWEWVKGHYLLYKKEF